MRDAASDLVGSSTAMKVVRGFLRQAARSSDSVLIVGEGGTGKTLAAQTIHALSARREVPLVTLTPAGVAETQLELEIFGSEGGCCFHSFIPRINLGQIARASGGTLLIEEVTELTRGLQTKLLHAIREKTYWPIGTTMERAVDLRVIATTKHSLSAAVKDGVFLPEFCELLTRAWVVLPPLRERTGDLEALARHILARQDRPMSLPEGSFASLARLPWAGNVRELRDFVIRLARESGNEKTS